jgi:hypothetical protein
MKKEEIIEKLRDDEYYYGEFGQQFLSNSNIRTLLRNPQAFGQSIEKTVAMLEGSYLHHKILEPEKCADYVIVKSSTRNTNLYKDAKKEHGADILLLEKEVESLDKCAAALMSNMDMYDLIRGEGVVYEEPGIKEIFGNTWKAKRDIGWPMLSPDIKSTSDILKFKRSAWDYNYDSAAWIYEQIFSAPMVFLVVDKQTYQIGIFTCSHEFKERGKQKVMQATAVYDTYFGPNATKDISNYMINEEL